MATKSRIQHHTAKLYDLLAASETKLRQRTVTRFAEKLGLTYFKTVKAHDYGIPVVRGVTASLRQRDANVCIGSYHDYDMVYVERISSTVAPNTTATKHYWHVMEFDLHHAHDLPFIFVGTQLQSKDFYAKIIAEHREVRPLGLSRQQAKEFHGHYTILGSPADTVLIHTIFDDAIVKEVTTHKEPFAIEIQGDSLFIIADNPKTSEHMLTRMLQYGIWMAHHIDQLHQNVDQ